MNLIIIIIAIVLVTVGVITLSIWLDKRGVTKDENDNYTPDVLEDKVKSVKGKVKAVKNIVKKKK